MTDPVSRGPAHLDRTPREHVAELVGLVGESVAAGRCVELLQGAHPDGLLLWLGGPAARTLVGRSDLGVHAYWPRVWGARGLLYCWDPTAASAVLDGLVDEAWRVREMCARVVRRRELAESADQLERLSRDEVPRVRIAAIRALGMIGEAEQSATLKRAEDDADPAVRRAAAAALSVLAQRLDRPL